MTGIIGDLRLTGQHQRASVKTARFSRGSGNLWERPPGNNNWLLRRSRHSHARGYQHHFRPNRQPHQIA